jgi:hypothetical protein
MFANHAQPSAHMHGLAVESAKMHRAAMNGSATMHDAPHDNARRIDALTHDVATDGVAIHSMAWQRMTQ